MIPISVTDGAELAKGRLLLMAQPPAQTAREPGRARSDGSATAGASCCSPIRCSNGRASGPRAILAAAADVRRHRPAGALGASARRARRRGPEGGRCLAGFMVTASPGRAVGRLQIGRRAASSAIAASARDGRSSLRMPICSNVRRPRPKLASTIVDLLAWLSSEAIRYDTDLSTGVTARTSIRTDVQH